MAIDCDHPRPLLNLPGYTPPRLNWQPPAFIPENPREAARVIRESLQGIYNELMRIAARGALVPLIDTTVRAREGQTIIGVADGQVIEMPQPTENGRIGEVRVIITDVIRPVTVAQPDGTEREITEAGVYDFSIGQEGEAWLTPPVLGDGAVDTSMLAPAPDGTFLANLFDEGDETPRWFEIVDSLGDGLTYEVDVTNENAADIITVEEASGTAATATSHNVPMSVDRLPGDRIVVALNFGTNSSGASMLDISSIPDWQHLDGQATSADVVSSTTHTNDIIELIIASDGSNDPGDTLTFTTTGLVTSTMGYKVWTLRDTHPTQRGHSRMRADNTSGTSRDVGLLLAPWRTANSFWGTFYGNNNASAPVVTFPTGFTTGQGQVNANSMTIAYGSQLLRADRLDADAWSTTPVSPRSAAFTFVIPPRETGQIQLSAGSSIAAATFLANLFDYAEESRAWALSDFASTGLSVATSTGNGPFPEIDDTDSLSFPFDVLTDPHECPVPALDQGQGVLMAVSSGGTATVTTPTERPWQALGTSANSSSRLTLFWLAPSDVTALVAAQTDVVSLDMSAGNGALVQFVVVDDHHPTQLPTLSAFVNQNGTTSTTTNDPAACTPVPGDGAAEANYTYVAILGTATEDSIVSAYPTDFTDGAQEFISSTNGSIDNSLAWCRRQIRGSSEDPGVFTYAASGNGRSTSVVVGFIPASVTVMNWDGVGVRENGSLVGTRRNINVLTGTKLTTTLTDDSANDEVEVQYDWDGVEVWTTSGVDQGDFVALQFADTTSILTDGGSFVGPPTRWQARFQRAALTGAIAAAQNSNATTFAGILDNGAAENDRTNLNFIAGTNTTATVTDDAGNDELEIRFNVDDFPLTGLADQAAETFNGNFTAGSAPPTARAGSSVAGAGLTYTAGGTLAVGAGDGIDVAADSVAVDVTDIVDNVSITEVATNNIQRAALTGAISASAGSNSTLFSGITDNGVSEADRATLNFQNSTTNTALITDSGTELQIEYRRAALTGAITASANSNATLFDSGASGAGLTGGGTAILAVGAGTGIAVNANDVAVDATWAEILVNGNNSGAFNPHIDTGQFIGFGAEGSLPGAGQLRSSTSWTAQVDGDLTLSATTAGVFINGAAALELNGSTDIVLTSGNAIELATGGTNPVDLTTGGWIRMVEEGASSPTVSAGQGMFWCLNLTPTQPMFTDDEDDDWRLGYAAVQSITADAAATNATTNLSGGSFTVPAGSCRVGTVYRNTLAFLYTHTAATTPTLTAELLIAGAVAQTAVFTPLAFAATFYGEVVALTTVRSLGAGGTCVTAVQFKCGFGNTMPDTLAAGATVATTAINTTATQTIELRIRMTTAVASNTLTVSQGFTERLR